MELVDIITQVKHLACTQKKYHVDRHGEYAQLVFRNTDLKNWLDKIEAILGTPIKKADQPVTKELVKLTEDFGEIFDHQILFFKEIDDQRVMAMFWPWRNQDMTTLKVMILNNI